MEKRFALVWRAIKGPNLACEYRFDPKRKWRFDFAHVPTRTAIELEGGLWSGGRHTRGIGFKEDCEKYNAAAAAGWTVFRLATGMVRVANAEAIRDYIADADGKRVKAIRIGTMVVMEQPGNLFWLQKSDGEGMETSGAKLAVALGKFWAKEF